jgi:hypothetical protein
MSKIPVFIALRIIPRETEFLDRKSGSRGEIFYDRDSNTLRLYDGSNQGGISLAKNDLTNVSNSVFAAKATAAGVGSSGGNTTVSVGASLPDAPSNGNLWLNTNNGTLYVYINDGDSNQWIQPAVPVPTLATVATSGDYDDLSNIPDLSVYVLNSALSSYATISYVNEEISAQQFNIGVSADDSTTRTFFSGDVIRFIGAGGVTTTSDIDGTITITGDGTTGDITFAGTTIDSSDSSSITITPAVIMQSDLTVENDLTVDNLLTTASLTVNNILLQGTLLTQGSGTPEIVSDNEIELDAGTRVDIIRGPIRMARFTDAERDLLIAQTGDMIYNTTTNKFQGYENGSWTNLI